MFFKNPSCKSTQANTCYIIGCSAESCTVKDLTRVYLSQALDIAQ